MIQSRWTLALISVLLGLALVACYDAIPSASELPVVDSPEREQTETAKPAPVPEPAAPSQSNPDADERPTELIWSERPLERDRSSRQSKSWRDIQARDRQISDVLRSEREWCETDSGVAELRDAFDPYRPESIYLEVAELPTEEEMTWLAEVASITAEVRGEELDELPEIRIIDRWDLRRLGCIEEFVIRWLVGNAAERRLEGLEAFRHLLTPLSREFSVAERSGVWLPLVGGAYHAVFQSARRITIIGSRPLPEQAANVAAHEFAHAIQDRRSPFGQLRSFGADSTDASGADRWLVEGEATAIASIVVQQPAWNRLMEERAWGESENTGDEHPVFANALRYNNLISVGAQESPYSGGSRFIETIREAGSWDAVDALFTNPPWTMEQIMHPHKLDQLETPVKLQDLTRLSKLVGGGWSIPVVDRMGESFLRGFLRRTLGIDSTAAELAAVGWGNDQLSVWTRQDDPQEALGVWQLAFDREFHHQQAWTAFRLWIATHSEGEAREALGLPVVGWDGPAGVVRLLQQGESIWLLAASDRALADDLTLAILDFPQTPYWSRG